MSSNLTMASYWLSLILTGIIIIAGIIIYSENVRLQRYLQNKFKDHHSKFWDVLVPPFQVEYWFNNTNLDDKKILRSKLVLRKWFIVGIGAFVLVLFLSFIFDLIDYLV